MLQKTTVFMIAFCFCAGLAATPAAAGMFNFYSISGPGGAFAFGPSPLLNLPDYNVGTDLRWAAVQLASDPLTNRADFTGVFSCAGTVDCTAGYDFMFAYMAYNLPMNGLVQVSLSGLATGAFSGTFSGLGSWGLGNVSLGSVSVSGVTGAFNTSSSFRPGPDNGNLYSAESTFHIDSLAAGSVLNLGVLSAEVVFQAAPEPMTFTVLGGGLGLLALFLRRRS